MIAKELINNSISPLSPTSTATFALQQMSEFKISHLPIVHDNIFLGIISEKNIQNFINIDEQIANNNFPFLKYSVELDQHIFDIIRIVADQKLSSIPVLNDKSEYIGLITTNDLIYYVSKAMALDNPGGIIILELNINDYNLTEIAHIVESNNTHIINLFVVSNPESTKLEINIKLNKFEIEPILQMFRRFNYMIKGAYAEPSSFENLRTRYDALINYLNI